MDGDQDATTASDVTQVDRSRAGWHRMPWANFPRSPGAFVRLPWSLVAYRVLLLLGIAVQAGLIYWGFELVDLFVSCVELWAELARKHLEITLA